MKAVGVQTLQLSRIGVERIGVVLLAAFVFFTMSALHLESRWLIQFNFEMILFLQRLCFISQLLYGRNRIRRPCKDGWLWWRCWRFRRYSAP